eukprot:763861-Hanusia_phi.AAC.1
MGGEETEAKHCSHACSRSIAVCCARRVDRRLEVQLSPVLSSTNPLHLLPLPGLGSVLLPHPPLTPALPLLIQLAVFAQPRQGKYAGETDRESSGETERERGRRRDRGRRRERGRGGGVRERSERDKQSGRQREGGRGKGK